MTLGARFRDVFQPHVRPFSCHVVADGNAARAPDDIGYERGAPRRDEGTIPNHEKHLRPRLPLHLSIDGRHSGAQVRYQLLGGLVPIENVPHIFQGLKGAFHRMRRNSVKRDAKAFKLICGFAPIGLIGTQDEIGPERHDFFQTGIQHGSHMRNGLRLRGIITIIRVPHQAVPQPQREQGFGDAGRNRNQAAGMIGQIHAAARLVGYYAR